ncbi:(2Fe-2S)-binding protein [Aeromicrobium sp. Sec7.5]|uniref:(2Fe-2S)-binding protein n=1 Tax=Aeromicrobium sp. Sec7.5 TaxID=3121276 RepID=UPI002FE48991
MGATGLARLGPFFVVEPLDDGPWRPVDGLVSGPALAERVRWTRDALQVRSGVDVEERVAASTASLGIFARVLSPAIGAALLGVPAPDPRSFSWQPVEGGPMRLAAPTWGRHTPSEAVDVLISPLVERLDSEHGVSTKIGWGNAVSAVHGAARMVAQADPALAPAAGRLLLDLLEHPLLSGTADVGPPFVRRSCCLYYRLPGGGYCGDCVLAHS